MTHIVAIYHCIKSLTQLSLHPLGSAESSVKRISKSAKNSTSFEHNTLENMWHDSDSGIPLDRGTFHFFSVNSK